MKLEHRALQLWSAAASAKRYRFPSWAADEWESSILPRFGPTARVYHASDADASEVRTMATFREPTNIEMNRVKTQRNLDEFYRTVVFDDVAKFSELFPEGKFSEDEVRNEAIGRYYRGSTEEDACPDDVGEGAARKYRRNLEGAYRFTTRDHRMPQIAAYAKTPMRYVHRGKRFSNEEGVHVLSLVGAGFDTARQPDYAYYFDEATRDIRADRRAEFYRERQVGFAIALRCAADHGLNRIEYVAVGAGFFSALLPGSTALDVQKEAWKSEEVQTYKSTVEATLGREIVLSFRTERPYSHCNGLGGELPSFYEDSGWTGNGHGRDWGDAIERTLFVNAWDPWSLVGNGNAMDGSVDGYYGRQSALALLCWPATNPHIQYEMVKF